MRDISIIPNTAEWLAIMADEPETVSVLHRHLLERQVHQGLMCDPSVLLSLEDYNQALVFVQQAQRNPKDTAALAAQVEEGRASLALPPAPAAWPALIAADPARAARLFVALQVKRAMLGPTTPVEIIQSIEAYKRCAQ